MKGKGFGLMVFYVDMVVVFMDSSVKEILYVFIAKISLIFVLK